MKIAIDCRSLRKPPAGVPNFLLSVVNSLAIQKKDWTIYLLSNEDFHEEVKDRLVDSVNVIKVIEPLFAFKSTAILWYILKIPFLVRRLKVDIFYTPIPNLPFFLPAKTKTVITLHDMVYKYFPETMSAMNLAINFFLHDRSVRKADFIWTVSEYTKRETELIFPDRRAIKIFVGSAVDKKYFIHKPFLLRKSSQRDPGSSFQKNSYFLSEPWNHGKI